MTQYYRCQLTLDRNSHADLNVYNNTIQRLGFAEELKYINQYHKRMIVEQLLREFCIGDIFIAKKQSTGLDARWIIKKKPSKTLGMLMYKGPNKHPVTNQHVTGTDKVVFLPQTKDPSAKIFGALLEERVEENGLMITPGFFRPKLVGFLKTFAVDWMDFNGTYFTVTEEHLDKIIKLNELVQIFTYSKASYAISCLYHCEMFNYRETKWKL